MKTYLKRFKAFESLEVPFIEIPDDTAIWCTKYYLDSQRFSLTGRPTITKEMKDATDELLKDYSDGYLYRGIHLYKEEYVEVKKKGFVETKYTPSSWTWDIETARSFAFPYDGYGLILKYPFKKLKNYFSMDVVMENIKGEQIKKLVSEEEIKEFNHYISESEIIAFDDHMKILVKDIILVKPEKKK